MLLPSFEGRFWSFIPNIRGLMSWQTSMVVLIKTARFTQQLFSPSNFLISFPAIYRCMYTYYALRDKLVILSGFSIKLPLIFNWILQQEGLFTTTLSKWRCTFHHLKKNLFKTINVWLSFVALPFLVLPVPFVRAVRELQGLVS